MFKRIIQTCSFACSLIPSFLKLISGIWKLSKLAQPAITVFGSGRLTSSDKYFQEAEKLARTLVEHGYSIISGGNGGIMESVTKGAVENQPPHHITTIGISIAQLPNTTPNPFMQPNKYLKSKPIIMPTLFSRKILLRHYADAFIIFPGGFGTMDELFEVLELTQNKRIERKPIILFGSDYWNPLLQCTKETLVANSFIKAEDINLVNITNDIEEVIEIITRRSTT